jgi:hypothetical protein
VLSRWVILLAVIAAIAALGARSAVAVQNDFFNVGIRQVLYGAGTFRVSADATFSLDGCSTYEPDCREVVQATFELRLNGRVISRRETETYPGSSSLSATLRTFAKCRRPGLFTPPHRTVRRAYVVILRATAYNGQTAVASRRTFIICCG